MTNLAPADSHQPCDISDPVVHPTTYFAPAGRDTLAEFRRKVALLEAIPMVRQVIEAMPTMVMVLNSHRQIVVANEALLTLLGKARGQVLEKRPGEALGCIRANEGPDGCGTARQCVTCGAVNAILETQRHEKKTVRECRVLVETPSGIAPMDLRVTASPLHVDGERFVVASVEDVSQTKQLAVMQRLFFHDVLNTAGCVLGYAQYLQDDGPVDRDLGERLAGLSSQLIESIQAQRDLLFAESGDLQMQLVPIRVQEVLTEIRLQYQKHSVAEGRSLRTETAWDGTIISDRQLLRRILGNMVKNALEATVPGGAVTLSVRDLGDRVVFAVHNAEVMPEEVQYQVFQRSFSTKGQSGRGVGTYSMKLLGERYLGGRIDFTSGPGEGTTFTLTLSKTHRGGSR